MRADDIGTEKLTELKKRECQARGVMREDLSLAQITFRASEIIPG